MLSKVVSLCVRLQAAVILAWPLVGLTQPAPPSAGPIPVQRAMPLSAPSAAEVPPLELEALTLSAAQRLLLQKNRDLRTARAALAAAEAALVSASKRPNPSLTVGGGTAQNNYYRVRDLDANIRIDQLIERGNKRRLRTEAADQAVQAAQLDIDDTFRRLRLALVQAYFDLKLSQDRIEIAQANAEAFARSVEAAERRLKAGDIAEVDLVRLRVDAGRSLNELRDARADLESARVVVAVLITQEQDAARIRAAEAWPALDPAAQLPPDIDSLLDQRADVRAALARVRSAEAALRLANALRTRDVSVGVFADHNMPTNAGMVMGVQVTVPLFIHNQFQGDILRATADLQAAVIAAERLRAEALAEVNRALVAFQSTAERLQRFERQIIPDAQRSAESAEFAYRRGAIPLTDLLDARRQFYGAQRELLDARSEYAKAQAALEASIRSPVVATAP